MANRPTLMQRAAVDMLLRYMRTGWHPDFVRTKFSTVPRSTWHRWVRQARNQFIIERGGTLLTRQDVLEPSVQEFLDVIVENLQGRDYDFARQVVTLLQEAARDLGKPTP